MFERDKKTCQVVNCLLCFGVGLSTFCLQKERNVATKLLSSIIFFRYMQSSLWQDWIGAYKCISHSSNKHLKKQYIIHILLIMDWFDITMPSHNLILWFDITKLRWQISTHRSWECMLFNIVGYETHMLLMQQCTSRFQTL